MNSHADIPMQKEAGRWLGPWPFFLLVCGLLAAMYPQVILGHETFFFRDYAMFGYPNAWFNRECFWRGELPLWNPLCDAGVPFLAQWNTLSLYPGSLLYLLFPMPWSLGIYCLIHLAFAAMGMYWLVRYWTRDVAAATVAGAAFAFNGLMVNCLMWPNNVACCAWMPWVAWAWLRAWREGGRWIFWGAGAGAMQLLAGTPEIIMLTWLVMGAVWLLEWWQSAGCRWQMGYRVAATGGLALALAAIQLLPFVELLRHAHRNASAIGDVWAMPGWGWANLMVPQFYTWHWNFDVLFQPSQGWTSSYYLGIGALALALAAAISVRAAASRLLACMVVVSLVMALGADGYLCTWIKNLVPPMRMMRFPVKFVVVAVFLVPWLAGIAWAHWGGLGTDERKTSGAKLAAAGLGLLCLIGGIAWFGARYPWGDGNLTVSAASRAGLLVLFCAVGVAVMQVRHPAWRASLALGAVALIWLDLVTHVPDQNPTVPSEAYAAGVIQAHQDLAAGRARVMSRSDTEYRTMPQWKKDATMDVLSKRRGAYGNCNMIDGIAKINGMASLHLAHLQQVLEVVYDRPDGLADGLADFLGVAMKPEPGKIYGLIPRQGYRPLVTAGAEPVYADDRAAAWFNSPAFNPRHQVVLPVAAKVGNPTNKCSAQVQLRSRTNSRWEFEVTAEASAWVVIAQAWYPAWSAKVDGQEAALWRANHAFQALCIPPGKHAVILAYRDRPLQTGMGISCLAAGACLVGIWRCRSGRRLNNKPPPAAYSERGKQAVSDVG